MRASALALALLAGCSGDDDAPPSPPAAATTGAPPRVEAPPQAIAPRQPEPVTQVPAAPTPPSATLAELDALQPGSCAVRMSVTLEAPLRELVGAPAVVTDAHAAIVARRVRRLDGCPDCRVYEWREWIRLERVQADGQTASLTSAMWGSEAGSPTSPPPTGLALAGRPEGGWVLASTTLDGRVRFRELDARGEQVCPTSRTCGGVGDGLIELGAEADRRFAPALAIHGDLRIVAYVRVVEGATRLAIVIVRDLAVVARHDRTPPQAGAAAPTFLRAEGGDPELFSLDARRGLSVLYRIAFDGLGNPSTPTVARPLGTTAEPPAVAVAQLGSARFVAYTAVGSGATRAVGILDLEGGEAPSPIVAGLGYGPPLTLEVALDGERGVIATEAPSAADPAAPHEVRLRTVSATGQGFELGAPLVLPSARSPSIAKLGEEFVVATDGGRVHFVVCR